jgi:hypothetical protein
MTNSGWICPVCGTGLAPSVLEHCKEEGKKKASTPPSPLPLIRITAPPRPYWNPTPPYPYHN